MHPAALLLGLACGGALVCAARRGCIIATLFAWSMVSVWAAANLAWAGLALSVMAIVELPVALAAYATWQEYGQAWQGRFAAVMASRLALYVFYPGAGAVGEAAFLHVLNFSFVAALVAISWTGGISDVADDCLRSLRRLRRGLPARNGALA